MLTSASGTPRRERLEAAGPLARRRLERSLARQAAPVSPHLPAGGRSRAAFRAGLPARPMRAREEILVVHPGALGDVLQAVPALAALREAVPCRLAFAGQPRLAGLLKDTGTVDEALNFESLG